MERSPYQQPGAHRHALAVKRLRSGTTKPTEIASLPVKGLKRPDRDLISPPFLHDNCGRDRPIRYTPNQFKPVSKKGS